MADRYSDVEHLKEAVENWSSENIPETTKCKAKIQNYDRDLIIQYRLGDGCAILFLLMWISGWTAGCITLITEVINKPELQTILFAVPFVIAWFFVAFFLLNMIFGVHQLQIGPYKLSYSHKIFIPISQRNVDIADIKGLTVKEHHNQDNSSFELVIRTTKQPISFAKGFSGKELVYLSDKIQRHLYQCGAGFSQKESKETKKILLQPEVLTAKNTKKQILKHSFWEMDFLYDGLEFRRKKTFVLTEYLKDVGTTMFPALFWNGIVSIFVLELIKDFNWLLFLFLIPFELIGLSLLFAWFCAILRPTIGESWSFSNYQITWRKSIAGIGYQKAYEIMGLKEIKLCFDKNAENYLLSFDEKVTMKGLTEADARWIAGEILHR